MTTESHKPECEACGSRGFEQTEKQGVMYDRCRDCGMHVRIPQEVTLASFERRQLPTKPRDLSVRLARLSTYLTTPVPTVLDVGCGHGEMLGIAEQCGWNVHGIETDAALLRHCLAHDLNCQAPKGTYFPYPTDFFDVVMAWNYLQRADDLAVTLAECFRVLKPGGLFAVEAANAECRHNRLWDKSRLNGRHSMRLRVFTRRSLRTAANRAGFETLMGPGFGRLEQLSLPVASYAFASQLFQRGLTLARANTTFQMFCRRPGSSAGTRSSATTVTRRRAA